MEPSVRPIGVVEARLRQRSPSDFEPAPVSKHVFLSVLQDATQALDDAGVEHAVIGGVGAAAVGRPRYTMDIDVFVSPDDAMHALQALGDAGFRTERVDEHWLYKAMRHGVLVDILFRAMGDVYFDAEVKARCREVDFQGVTIKVASPEDMILIKAISFDEQTPRHWYDALGILAAQDVIDYEYLLHRAGHRAKRMLAFLAFAQSNDLVVPDEVILSMASRVYGI